eukprot:jgi/Tetstr1/456973/TSEL_004158.t1
MFVPAALAIVATRGLAADAAVGAAAPPSTASRIRGATLGALVADALTLGTHYEYDAAKIKRFYGDIDRYYAPGQRTGGETHGVGWGSRNYHGGNGNGPPKRAGEQTDYGDYNLLVLEHLAATADQPRPIDLQELVPFWLEKLRSWRSWICTQTRQTVQQVQAGVPLNQLGGNSNAMAIRYAAAYGYFNKEEDVVQAALTSMFTHRERTAREGAEFFARVTFRVIHSGLSPEAAIRDVSQESSPFIQSKVQQALDKVAEAADANSPLSSQEYADDLALTSMARLWDVGKSEPIKVGKASPTEGTLPGSVYFIVRYAGNFTAAASANSAVGGDNASRAVAIGMVMGAAEGLEGIPAHLGPGHLVEWESALQLMDKLPLLRDSTQKEEL